MAVTEGAISTIKEMIVSGELKPGARLPSEKELSESLGLSRNSLREAVKSLEMIHVLEVRRGDGTYVTSLEPRLLLEAVTFAVELHQDSSVIDILEVRRILESHAAATASSRISDEQIELLTVSLAQLNNQTPVEELVQHDLDFHRTITAACNNDYLISLVESMSSVTTRARIWRGITEAGSVERTLAEHRNILSALRDRNPELASAWMIAHVSGVESWLRAAS
jgi:GntR family transcriptional repressor for pyruvate dehydrogenase complex